MEIESRLPRAERRAMRPNAGKLDYARLSMEKRKNRMTQR